MVINGYVDDAVGLSAYMDISALGSLIGEPQTVSGFFLQVEGGKLRELYRKLKETPLVFSVFSPAGLRNSFMQTIARTMNVSTGILLSFAVIIAFGVVYNSARISLSERGRELASLRVMGFSRSETLYFLLGEQGAILIASMPIGFLCGYLISWLIINVVDTELMRLTLAVSTRTYVLSGLVVNLRMMVYSAALAPKLRHLPRGKRMLVAAFLVDNLFAFLQERERERPGDPHWVEYYAGMTLVLWPSWALFCVVGVFAGNIIPANWQLDFAIPLSFVAILANSVRQMPLLAAAVGGGIASVLLFTLPLKLGLIAGCLCGLLAGLLVERMQKA